MTRALAPDGPPAESAARANADRSGLRRSRLEIGARYRAGLHAFVEGGQETDLMTAYELARITLSRGIPLADLPAFHFAATESIPAESRQSPLARERIELFLLEFIAVYDMALQGYRTTVPQLQAEIADRRRVEAALQEMTVQLAAERDNLDRVVAERTQELRRKAWDLEKTLDRLRQTNREQAEFTYALSHDLKSPSNTLSLLVQELQIAGAEKLDAEGQELLDLAGQTAQRMARLVDDVLAYSRCIEMQSPFVLVDLNAVLAEIVADLRFDLQQSGAELQLADLPPVGGDRMQLKLLFQNLLTNALKFRDPARPLKVSVSRRMMRGNRVLVTVRDTGIGIAPEHFERVFGLFKRLHTHGTYQGSGIGLALCRRIAGNLGGDIRLTSEPGKGSSFTVKLNRYVE